MQAESSPANLVKAMKAAEVDPDAFELFTDHDFIDLLGSVVMKKKIRVFNEEKQQIEEVNGSEPDWTKPSLTANSLNYQSWKEVVSCLREAKDPKEAYLRYLQMRAGILNSAVARKSQPLDVSRQEDYALTRLYCMGRLGNNLTAEAEKIANLKSAFCTMEQKHPEEFKNLVEELNTTGLDSKPAILVYYSPNFITSAINASIDSNDKDKKIIPKDEQAILNSLLILNDLYKQGRKQLVRAPMALEEKVLTIHILDLANHAGSEAARKTAIAQNTSHLDPFFVKEKFALKSFQGKPSLLKYELKR